MKAEMGYRTKYGGLGYHWSGHWSEFWDFFILFFEFEGYQVVPIGILTILLVKARERKRRGDYIPYSYKFSRGQIFAHPGCAKYENFRADKVFQ